MSNPAVRLVLVEDHAIVLSGLEHLFSQDGRFQVVASCRDGAEALEAVRRGNVDVMVLDLKMPRLAGTEVLAALRREQLACKVVLLTAAITDAEALEVQDLGASGLVLKESSTSELMECVLKVHAGGQWFDKATMARVAALANRQEAGRREASRTLTPREIEIVRLIAQGHRNKGIADRLSISEGTVKIHLHNVYEKIGVDGRLGLLLWVKERGVA